MKAETAVTYATWVPQKDGLLGHRQRTGVGQDATQLYK